MRTAKGPKFVGTNVFKLQNSKHGIFHPNARLFARLNPTRMPVKEPGPDPTAILSGFSFSFKRALISRAISLERRGPPTRGFDREDFSKTRPIKDFSVAVSKRSVFIGLKV